MDVELVSAGFRDDPVGIQLVCDFLADEEVLSLDDLRGWSPVCAC